MTLKSNNKQMKYIIIGLGNFGSVLAERLTMMGHEVIGVDMDPHRVDDLKQSITSTICLDSRDPNALNALPFKDADAVFVTIGEDFGASIHVIALVKQYNVKKLIGRAISPLHKTVMEAIGVDEIVMPEREYAETYATRIEISGVHNSYMVDDQHSIMEVPVPKLFIGQTVEAININENFSLSLIAIKRTVVESKYLWLMRETTKLIQKFDDQTTLQEKDILLMFGKVEDFQKFRDL